jgi:hypothetical protein
MLAGFMMGGGSAVSSCCFGLRDGNGWYLHWPHTKDGAGLLANNNKTNEPIATSHCSNVIYDQKEINFHLNLQRCLW